MLTAVAHYEIERFGQIRCAFYFQLILTGQETVLKCKSDIDDVSIALDKETILCTLFSSPVKARLHRRFLSRELDAVFVARKLQLQNLNSERLTVRLGLTVYNFQYFVRHGLTSSGNVYN